MKPTSIVISSLKHLCFVSFFVQMFICSGCKTSNSVPSNLLVNERLSSIKIPAIITGRGLGLGTVVDYLNSAMDEYGPRERDGGKRNIVFECSHSLRKREIESVPLGNLPLGYGSTLWMPMSDYIDDICLRAQVDFVIIGNRVIFVERRNEDQASKNDTN